jgi:uncharacterized protein (DUF3084 family)
MMKQLAELEKRIVQIIEAKKKLSEDYKKVQSEKYELQESNVKLENLLLKENGSVDTLSKEKDSIKIAIEHLLESIDKLEPKS